MRPDRFFLVALVLIALLVMPAIASGDGALIANSDAPVLIKVGPPPPERSGRMGLEVAMFNDTMAALSDSAGDENPALLMYERDSSGWRLTQRIALPEQPHAVALEEETVAVTTEARVLVWVRNDGGWAQQASLPNPSTRLLLSVALDGDTMAVGAPYDSEAVDEPTGRVYLYVRSGGVWALAQTLDSGRPPHEVYIFDRFGESVDVENGRVVVGALEETTGNVRAHGAVYVFEPTPAGWVQDARLTVPGAAEFDGLGGEVSLEGDRIVASQSGWYSQTGAIRVWEKRDTGWVATQHVYAPDGRPGNLVDYNGDCFGSSIAFEGDTLVVGAPMDDDAGVDSGSLYILRLVGDRFVHHRKIAAPDKAANGYFGASVTASNGRAAVGMPGYDVPVRDSGLVYAFDLGYVTPVETTLTVEAPRILVNDLIPDPEAVTATASITPSKGVLDMQPSSAFTYTPASKWRGNDYFTYVCTDGSEASNPATVTVSTWQPTKLSLSASTKSPSYGGSSTLKATLVTPEGKPIAGRTVTFEYRSGYQWYSAGTAVTGASGTASKTVSKLTSGRTFRARTGYSADFGAAGTSLLRVNPKVSLSTPSAPKSVRRSASFSVTGYLKPRHTSGTKPVKLSFSRYESGRWVVRKTVYAKVKNYSSYSKYYVTTSVPYRGSWKVGAYHAADTSHSATTSSSRKFTAR